MRKNNIIEVLLLLLVVTHLYKLLEVELDMNYLTNCVSFFLDF